MCLIQKSNASISHEDGDRIATASAQLKQGANAVEINKQFQAQIKEDPDFLPAGVSLKTGGENEDIAKTFTEMVMALIAGLLLVIVVLILQFNSFRQTFFIVAGVLLSLIGVLFGLTIIGSVFSFPSFIGVIALAGIVVNNAIILIDTMNKMKLEKIELSIREVVIKIFNSSFETCFINYFDYCYWNDSVVVRFIYVGSLSFFNYFRFIFRNNNYFNFNPCFVYEVYEVVKSL